MEIGELSEAFAEEWSLAVGDAVLRDDADATELEPTGRVLVASHVAEAARSIRPQSVEQTVRGEIDGVKVRGMVDLLDVGAGESEASAYASKGDSAECVLWRFWGSPTGL